jgi:hypothetical protein
MLYKIQNNFIDIDQNQYLTSNDRRTRGQHEFYQERITNDVYSYRNSFSPRPIRDWNQLPTNITTTNTVEGFRAALKAVSMK